MKTFKTHVEQLELLKRKHLCICDENFALQILQRENYFNLINGYRHLFLDDAETKTFNSNATFEEVYHLYLFDRKLRNLLLEHLLAFETALKSKISYHFSNVHPHPNDYLDIANYSTQPSLSETVSNLIASTHTVIQKESVKSNATRHYLNHYQSVPLWVLIKSFNFGHTRLFFSCLTPQLRTSIAKTMSNEFNSDYQTTHIIRPESIDAIIKTINFYRNVCAHEERLFCFKITHPSKSNQIAKMLQIDNQLLVKGNLFTLITFLKLVLPKSNYLELLENLDQLFQTIETTIKSIEFEVVLMSMGFSNNWKSILMQV